ncbi:amino acid decarboxylase [Streptomyces sp. NPDC047971]|uniref:Orn/Lys/Arg family decarboxylase n=1 Tax=Streptomyces sp. NPDC047971 TaxID=3154499 RepID=UPI0033ED51E2
MSLTEIPAARRTWVLTRGGPLSHCITGLIVPALGGTALVQRDAPASLFDGLVVSGLDARSLPPVLDPEQGIAHCVRSEDLAAAAAERTDVAAALVVSPTRYGAVADIRALADAAHASGVPLIVDESRRSPVFGRHPGLLPDALAYGADLSVSAGPPPVLRLGDGPHAELLRPLVERAVDLTRQTSCDILPARSLAQDWDQVLVSLETAAAIGAGVRKESRFSLVADGFGDIPGIAGADPLRIAINTDVGGVTGREAHRALDRAGLGRAVVGATQTVITLTPGDGTEPDAERFLDVLHALPAAAGGTEDPLRLALPEPGPRRLTLREAFFGHHRVVDCAEAVGLVSASRVTACPPGVPVLLPGEVVTAETVAYLRLLARSRGGRIQGAADAGATTLGVVQEPTGLW